MILYVMRHGEAVSAHEWREGDKTRPLSKRGEQQLEAAVPEWKRLSFFPRTVLSSPLTRAQQTAAYVNKANPRVAPTVLPELASGAKPDTLRNAFVQPQWEWPLLFVGHMPELAFLSSRLTHEAYLMEASIEPGETLAFEAPDKKIGWGSAKLLWRRKIDEWKKAEEL